MSNDDSVASQAGGQLSIVGAAVRDLGRLRRVAAIVARHGFGELVMRTPLGRRLFERGQVPPGDAAMRADPPAVRLTKLLAALGPTYIKLGQILSTRKDLFSTETIEALEKLQDRAPGLPFEAIRSQVELSLGAPLEELFSEFRPEPLATASIAQTHRATTHEGVEVVVKVQRPGIEQLMRSDLDLLYLAAQVLEASIDELQLLGVSAIVQEFEPNLLGELDFRTELNNLLLFRQNLDPARNVSVPRPHPDLSTRQVLTMDFFAGRSMRTLSPESKEASRAVEEVVHAACKQVFIDGLFHGDPHAGNILLNEAGVLCLVDLGMVGHLSKEQRDQLVTLVIAVIAGDSSTIARVLLQMGTPTQRVNLMDLRDEIERIRTRYLEVGSLADYDSAGFAEEFAKAAGKFRIKLAAEYSLLVKAGATIEGIIRHLHPSIDLASIARPYAQQILARRLDPRQLLRQFIGEASSIGTTLQNLPAQLDQVFHDLETGNIQVRAMTPELDALPGVLHQLGSRVTLGMFALSMTLATAVLASGSKPSMPQLVLAIACGLTAASSWTILFWWHFVGRGKPFRLSPWLRLFRR
jgi:ubiquinone biosynthesis protein